MKTTELKADQVNFYHMGNGWIVATPLIEEHGDYMRVAHIKHDRTVTYYKPISESVKQRIEIKAASDTSTQNDKPILKPLVNDPLLDFPTVDEAMTHLVFNDKATKKDMLTLYRNDIVKVGEQVIAVNEGV